MILIRSQSNGLGWSAELKQYLLENNIIISSDRGNNTDVVVCAPHHAPKGVRYICQPSRIADCGSGFVAASIADILGARLVVACAINGNDPNKITAKDDVYQLEVFRDSPKLIIEIHGMGKRSSEYDVEISHNDPHIDIFNDNIIKCLTLCHNGLPNDKLSEVVRNEQYLVGIQSKNTISFNGSNNFILQKSKSLNIIMYQIELKSKFRISKRPFNMLPRRGQYISRVLSIAIYNTHHRLGISPSPQLC